MAKKRRKRRGGQLGGGPLEHFRKAEQADEAVRMNAGSAVRLANEGKCRLAIRTLVIAADRYGEAQAHHKYAHPAPFAKLPAAYRKRMAKIANRSSTSRVFTDAEAVVLAKCVVG